MTEHSTDLFWTEIICSHAVIKSSWCCAAPDFTLCNRGAFFMRLLKYYDIRHSFASDVMKVKNSVSNFLFWFFLSSVAPTGAVPVCAVDRHSLLSTAPWSAAPQRGQREGEATFPPNHRCCRGSRSEERSHALLDSGETQVLQFGH